MKNVANKNKVIEQKIPTLSGVDIPIAKKYETIIRETIKNRPGNMSSGIKLGYSTFFRYPRDIKIIANFAKKKILAGKKINLLEIGIGNLQELSSYLIAIKKAANSKKTLKECLVTEIVELRGRKSIAMEFGLKKPYGIFRNKELSKNALSIKPPEDYADFFYFNEKEGVNKFSYDIQEYVNETVSNTNTAHFSTSIEDYLSRSKNQADIVACNNVLQYLGGFGVIYSNPLNKGAENIDITKFIQIVKSITERVKEGGLLIMHIDTKKVDRKGVGAEAVLNLLEDFSLDFTKIAPGVYQRNITDNIETPLSVAEGKK